jgi:hypothetical protein
MFPFVISLFIAPVFVSALLLIVSRSFSRILIIASSFFLSAISLYLFIHINELFYFGLPHYVNDVIAGADILLLLFFGWIVIRYRSWIVGLLTLVQLGALMYLHNI